MRQQLWLSRCPLQPTTTRAEHATATTPVCWCTACRRGYVTAVYLVGAFLGRREVNGDVLLGGGEHSVVGEWITSTPGEIAQVEKGAVSATVLSVPSH